MFKNILNNELFVLFIHIVCMILYSFELKHVNNYEVLGSAHL